MINILAKLTIENSATPEGLAWLSGLYLVCMIVGGGMLLISTVFGGEADADLDVDLDVDADFDIDTDMTDAAGAGHASHLALSDWFSMSFVVYFVACFGVVGSVLTHLADMTPPPVLLWAVLSGLVVGQGVHHLMRKVKKAEAVPPASAKDYANKTARVTIATKSGSVGEVALMVRGRERFVAARTKRDDDEFKINDQVVVVAFVNGTAEIISKKEYEFVTDSTAEED